MYDRQFDEQGLAFISSAQAEGLRNVELQRDDLLLNITGDGVTFARSCIVPDSILPACVNQHVAIVRVNPEVCIPGYLLAFLTHPLVKSYMESFNTGGSRRALTKAHIESFEVPIPPLPVQRRIAGILSAYDELIENSQRRIRLLEDMARALYREWFIHFRFPGHESVPRLPSALGDIPQGWEVGKLEDILVLQRGFDLPKAQRVEGSVPIYAATGINGYHNEAKVKAPGIVTGRSGSLGEVVYVQEDFWPLNTALWVKEFPKSEPLYAYFLLSEIDLKGFNSGAAVPTLNRNDIHGLDALIPPRELQRRFQAIAGAMLHQSRTLTLQIQNLRRTRDLLLPRLLSGQVALEEAAN